MDSVALYRTLDCGWVECGGIRIAEPLFDPRGERVRGAVGAAAGLAL